MSERNGQIVELLLKHFRGRADYVAVGQGATFAPQFSVVGATSEMMHQHLNGTRCHGFYLLDAENRVYCSVVDFDNKPAHPDPLWKEKAEKLYIVLSHLQLSPVVELSQSGSGCHVWIFFDEPVEAWLARAWWKELSAKIEVDMKEVYPRQDELKRDAEDKLGLGNLIRYPLFNLSSFVDVENEWAALPELEVLQGIRRTSATDLNTIAFQLGMELKGSPKASILVSSEIGEIISLRVQKIVEKPNTLLHRRWNGDMAGMHDKSNSAVAMSIAVELVRQYVPTPEIATAIRYWCKKNGAQEKGRRDDWVNLTVSKAYDFILSRTETKSLDATTFQRASHMFLDMLEQGKIQHQGSGIDELDDSIDGIAEGEVWVLAARPSMGKSSFAFQWMANSASFGMAGLVISEEMSSTEIGKRRLSSISEIPHDQWVAASVGHMRREIDEYNAPMAPVYIVENCNTIDRVEEVVDQFCSLHGVGIVAIDYLQLLGSRSTDRYEVVTEVSRRIKQMTRRNNCRTLLLSQLNRECERRGSFDPKMSDLRESGGIEQDADGIMFLYWPWKANSDNPQDEYVIYVGKRRNGPIREAKIVTKFNPYRQQFGAVKQRYELCPV